MYATLLADARFHELLLAIDRDLADAARAQKQALLAQYAGHTSWSVQLHYDNLVALAESHPERMTAASASAAPSTAAGDA